MSLPPTLNASLNETGSECDAGQQVVGEDDLLARALVRLFARILLVEHGRGEGCRAAISPCCVSVNASPNP